MVGGQRLRHDSEASSVMLAERPDGSPRHGRRGFGPLNGRDCGQGLRSRDIRLAGLQKFQRSARLETGRSKQPDENTMCFGTIYEPTG